MESSHTVVEDYLKPAILGLGNANQNPARAYYQLARVADSMWQNITDKLKSPEWNNTVKLREKKVRKFKKILFFKEFQKYFFKNSITTQTFTWDLWNNNNKNVYFYIISDHICFQKQQLAQFERLPTQDETARRQARLLTKQIQDFDKEASNITRDQTTFLVLAFKSYMQCLKIGISYDVQAAYRLISLWFSNSKEDILSREFQTSLSKKELDVRKLIPLFYQIASRSVQFLSRPFTIASIALYLE